jgi:hypothetical protein
MLLLGVKVDAVTGPSGKGKRAFFDGVPTPRFESVCLLFLRRYLNVPTLVAVPDGQ